MAEIKNEFDLWLQTTIEVTAELISLVLAPPFLVLTALQILIESGPTEKYTRNPGLERTWRKILFFIF